MDIQQPIEENEDHDNLCLNLSSCCAVLILVFVLIVTVSAVFSALSMAFFTTVALASLSLLVVSFLITRALQFFKHGDNYDTAVNVKVFIRAWIYTCMSSLLITLAIFYGIAKHNHNLKHTMIRGKSLANWVHLYFVVFGIYALNWFLSVLVFKFVPVVPLDHSESGLQVPESVLEIIDCLIFWLAESQVIKRVPDLKNDELLGLQTRRWVEVSVFLLIGHNVITLSTRFIVLSMRNLSKKLYSGSNKKSKRYLFVEKMMHKKYLVYSANGIKYSIDFILTSLMLLLTWVLYFGSHLDVTSRAKKVYDIGTWTCVTLLICGFLWLVKTCVLLTWEARKVYERLGEDILEGGKQLYFLGLIGRHTYDIFNFQYDIISPEKEILMAFFFSIFPLGLIDLESRYYSEDDFVDDETKSKKFSIKRKELVKDNLVIKKCGTPTMYDIQQAGHYFLKARETLNNDAFTSAIFLDLSVQGITSSVEHDNDIWIDKIKLRQLIEIKGSNDANEENNNNDDENPIFSYYHRLMKNVKKSTDEKPKNDWDDFEEQVCENKCQITLSFDELENWMERARNHCLFLANTLESGKEAVDVLSKIFSSLVIGAMFILWLLLTGFATTRVLVLIASPLLAATFIFGDTCKSLFQGIIYSYVVNLFNVGDLCVIDGNMMEVRRLGIWVTTFSKVSTQEEVIYPTSELSTKNITNHKTNFDWNDNVEVEVPRLLDHGLAIFDLQAKIENYLNGQKDRCTLTSIVASKTEISTKIILNIRFNVKKNKKRTYFQCYKEKVKLTSELTNDLQNLVDEGIKSGGTDHIE